VTNAKFGAKWAKVLHAGQGCTKFALRQYHWRQLSVKKQFVGDFLFAVVAAVSRKWKVTAFGSFALTRPELLSEQQ
jgi:hypothetical protein